MEIWGKGSTQINSSCKHPGVKTDLIRSRNRKRTGEAGANQRKEDWRKLVVGHFVKCGPLTSG